jgi:flagellar biogenesis protein FliO
MKKNHLSLIAAAVQFHPFLAHAEAEQNAQMNSTVSNLLWGGIPLLILLVIFLFLLFLIVRFAQSGPRARRADQHMERVEQQLERIAKALEKKD